MNIHDFMEGATCIHSDPSDTRFIHISALRQLVGMSGRIVRGEVPHVRFTILDFTGVVACGHTRDRAHVLAVTAIIPTVFIHPVRVGDAVCEGFWVANPVLSSFRWEDQYHSRAPRLGFDGKHQAGPDKVLLRMILAAGEEP